MVLRRGLSRWTRICPWFLAPRLLRPYLIQIQPQTYRELPPKLHCCLADTLLSCSQTGFCWGQILQTGAHQHDAPAAVLLQPRLLLFSCIVEPLGPGPCRRYGLLWLPCFCEHLWPDSGPAGTWLPLTLAMLEGKQAGVVCFFIFYLDAQIQMASGPEGAAGVAVLHLQV